MAISRVNFEPDIDDMTDIIYKTHGNVAMIAKHFKVARQTIYQFLKAHSEINEIIEAARLYCESEQLDDAEYVMTIGLKMYDTDYKKAFEAAKYVLDKKGHKRGWGTDGKPQHEKAVDNQLQTLISQSEEVYNKMKEEQ
jgi:hypothetical protein